MTTPARSSLPPFAAGLLFLTAPLAPLRACGPDFPTSYLAAPFSEQTQLPTLGFRGELDRLRPPEQITAAARLAAASDPAREAEAELAELRTVDPKIDHSDRLHPPASLPAEFQLYARGALAWREHETGAATAAWKELLALPAEQRHFRSTWAAYMLGKAASPDAGGAAHSYWALTRQLAASGFADSQHLALGSWGEEAQAELRAGHAAAALVLYWQQYQSGAPSSLSSLQATLRQVFFRAAAPDRSNLAALADDAASRAVVTAWFVARGGPYQTWHHDEAERFRWWLSALSGTDRLAPAEADRWAWAAYAAGEWATAQTLVDRAPADAPASEWARGLLVLRRGQLEDAANHLSNAARGFPLGQEAKATDYPAEESDLPHDQLEGVRGALALRRDQYFEALRIFSAAKHWTDAAFVAEKVLTVDELKAYVTTEVKTGLPPPNGADQNVSYLLARRLMRAKRFNEARPFYPTDKLKSFDAFIAASRLAYDEAQPKSARAAAFWTAAQILEKDGMALMGTELEPDYAVWDGSFQYPDLIAARENWTRNWMRRERYPAEALLDPLAPSPAEEDRTFAEPTPKHRFHYRYRASELAWLAAALSPDDDPATAEILATAGRWIAARDPAAADLFYKALALRCPHTELGKLALESHWLPKT